MALSVAFWDEGYYIKILIGVLQILPATEINLEFSFKTIWRL